ncbi:radical SAM protein [Clostridia bacterium OttesenSCG-928-O13]|nr:radical SAM protein [Clostridia bacterium OttesenSCG-928-O13]
MLRVYRTLPTTAVDGPGLRYCLWVQGCPHRCPGCAAPETWPDTGGQMLPVADVAKEVLATKGIEGITFLGGEPFAQAEPLARLASVLRREGLSVLTFTGYTLARLRACKDKGAAALLAQTDLLIDGPFVREQFDLSRPWVGSANQEYHFLTDRYGPAHLQSVTNKIEVRIAPDGSVLISGMGDFDKIKKLVK